MTELEHIPHQVDETGLADVLGRYLKFPSIHHECKEQSMFIHRHAYGGAGLLLIAV